MLLEIREGPGERGRRQAEVRTEWSRRHHSARARPCAFSYRGLSSHLHTSFQEGAEVLSKSTRGSSQVLGGSPRCLYQFCGCLIQPSSSLIQPALSFLKRPGTGGKLQGQKVRKSEVSMGNDARESLVKECWEVGTEPASTERG